MPTIWRACSMRGAELENTAAIPRLTVDETGSDGGDAIAGVAVAAAPVEFVLTSAEVPPVAAARPRSRGTLPMVGMFVLMLIAGLYFGRAVLMPVLFGIVMAVVLTPIVDKLSRFGIPEPSARPL